MSSQERPLPSGAFNFRDLGGLPLRDGRRVRPGRLYRSDTLQALTQEDVCYLHDHCGVRTVVDLRLAVEVRDEGRGLIADCGDVNFINSPLEMASTDGIPAGEVLQRLYERSLASESLPRAITSIAEQAERPLLIHCAAGKDRTGIVAAMVLGLIGVELEAIVGDYMRSRAAMPWMLERFSTWPRYREHVAAMPPEVYAVEEGPIRHLLALVEEEFGGIRQWASQRGIPPSAVERLQLLLVGSA